MKYFESQTTELKREVCPEIKKEIVAFLNSYGGTIYVGVNDDGTVYYNLSEKEKDIELTKIVNWLSTDIILPNPREHVNLSFNEDGVLVISVSEGISKPYYLKESGLTPNGVYLRYESSKFQASYNEIKELALKSKLIHFEDLLSKDNDLTFNYLFNLDINFNLFANNFIYNNSYTNLAYIFSDNYNNISKIFITKNDKIVKKLRFSGSILKQINEILLYFKNNYSNIYNILEEAVLNAFVHRNYNVRENIRIEISDNSIKFISPGGIYDFTDGTGLRNPKIKKVLKYLNYSKTYKSNGIKEIFNLCKKNNLEAIVITTSKEFILKITNKRKGIL